MENSLYKLADDEKTIMRSLGLLGNGVIVDRGLLCSWIGENCHGSIDALVKNGWIQSSCSSAGEDLSLSKETGDLARDLLKPNLQNCGCALDLLNRIADDLAAQKENAKINMGVKGRAWDVPDEYERAICMMPARLALNIFENLDFAKIETVNCCIDFLRKSSADSVLCAVYFGLHDVPLLERITSSPCFDILEAKQKFEVYNIFGIAWAAVLVNLLLHLPDEQQFIISGYSFWQAAYKGSRIEGETVNEEHLLSLESDSDRTIISTFSQQKASIVGRIVERYSIAERYAESLPEKERLLCQPRIFMPLMEVIGSICSSRTRRNLLFLDGNEILKFVRGFEDRNALSPTVKKEYRHAYKALHSGLFPKRRASRPKKAHSGFSGECKTNGADSDSGDRGDYYGRITECISITELDKIATELFEDQSLSTSWKTFYLQNVVELLGYAPFESYMSHDYEEELIKQTYTEVQRGETDTSDLILYCPSTEKQRRATDILSHISVLMEPCEVSAYREREHYAQLMLLACDMVGDGAGEVYIDKYYDCIPEDGGEERQNIWELLAPIVMAVSFTRKLQQKGFTGLAREMALRGLDMLENEAKKPHRNNKNRYDIFGLAMRLAESIEDEEKIEHYKRRRSETLELGFIIDIYEQMGRE